MAKRTKGVAQRKFTDLSVGFCSSGALILHAKDLKSIDESGEKHKELADNCHIYFILSRPRVSYVPDSFRIQEDATYGAFKYLVEGVAKYTDFKLSGKMNPDLSLSVSSYPHSKLNLSHNGEVVHSIPAHLMSFIAEFDNREITDLEVEYVGMSYAEGRRSAKDRLQSHSTLQSVLADLNNEAPDKEVLLGLFEFASPRVMMVFNGRDKTLDIDDDRDFMSDIGSVGHNLSKDLQIALIEAGLIKYFRPKYNEKYKHRFPHPTHSILEELYGVNIAALSVEVNSEELRCRMYSPVMKPGYHHIASFDLHDAAERTSFFNVLNMPEGPNADGFSGPFY